MPARRKRRTIAGGLVLLFALAMTMTFLGNPRGRLLPIVNAAAVEAPSEPNPTDARLNVLSYNAFIRPEPVSYGDRTTCRAQRIGSWLADHSLADIVVLAETFQRADVDLLTREAQRRFPYSVVGKPAPLGVLGVSGGLSILSRFPIVHSESRPYTTCAGTFSDCLATKGVLWAELAISSELHVNVVATHLDSGGSAEDKAARKVQLAEMRAFIDQRVNPKWPTLVMGDFNIDGMQTGAHSEYREMIKTLKGALHTRQIADAVHDVAKKFSARFRGHAMSSVNCDTTIWCADELPDPEKLPRLNKRIDYVFAYDAPGRHTHILEARHEPMQDGVCGGKWLSDHKAVEATVEVSR